MNTVNKKKLINEISEELGYPQIWLNTIVTALFNQIIEEYKKGNRVEIRGFGTFYPHLRKSKPYKDPNTLKPCIMPTKTLLKFKSSKQNQL